MNKVFSGLVALLLAQPVLALDVKGVELGAPATASQMKDAFDLDCHGRNAYCHGGYTQVAGEWVHSTALFNAAGALAKLDLDFRSGSYFALRNAAIEKYGAPSGSEVIEMQTGAGAHLQDHETWWNDASGGRVWLVQFLGSASEGRLSIESAAYRRAEQATEDAAKAKSRM